MSIRNCVSCDCGNC